MGEGEPTLSDDQRGIITESSRSNAEILSKKEQSASQVHESWATESEAPRVREAFSLPRITEIEVLGSGNGFSGPSQEGQQTLLVRLETSQAAGEVTAVEDQEDMQRSFDPEQYARQMIERVKDLRQDQVVESFLNQLNVEDQKTFKNVLNKSRNNPKFGPLSQLMMGIAFDEDWKTKALGSKIHNEAELRGEYVKFANKMLAKIEQSFTPNEVLGFDKQEIDLGSAIKRSSELVIHGLAPFGSSPEPNFYRFLINQSVEQIRRESEKKKVAEIPIADKKELEETTEQIERPQEWLDQDREEAFRNLTALFNDIRKESGPEGIQQWMMDLYNPALASEGRELLSREDLKSLDCFDVHSVGSSEVAGQKIVRPVLVFKDPKELENLVSRLTGRVGSETSGFVIPKALFEGSLLGKTGLLITNPNEHVLGHEIRHTIDPLLGSREGYDRMIDEVFAFYHDNLLESNDERNLSNKEDESWRNFAESIGHETYFQNYSDQTEKQLTMHEFSELSNLVIRAVRLISERLGHLATQRALPRVRTLKELFSLASQELPAVLQ